ncbi:MAG: cell division protein ZapA [Neisseria sp.]|nr:cell division protein ZapA [Neisseria sp.]
MNKETVQIDILNRRMAVAVPQAEKAAFEQALDLLQQKVEIVQSSGKNLDADKVLILAALNAVHGLLGGSMPSENAAEHLADEAFASKIAKLLEICENALAQAGS